MHEPIEHPQPFEHWRLTVFYVLVGLVIGFYILRLFNLQILQGTNYRVRAEDNRTMEISTPTQRGLIYDRNGYLLAKNVPSYNVVITPAELPTDEGGIQEVYRQLSQLIGVPVNNGEINEETVRNFTPCATDLGIAQIVYIGDTNAPYSPIRIKCNIDQQTAMIIRERAADLPGVGIEVESVREYPTGSLTSTIVGFLGPIPASEEADYRARGFLPNRDKVGFAGVEYSLNDLLIGQNGKRVVEVDAAGQILRDLEPPVQPVPGYSVKLTIDTRLQAAAEAALVNWMDRWNRYFGEQRYTSGVVIAMNPKTGEILAMVSYPSYENNRMARFIPAYYYEQLQRDPYRPLLNHAISAEHPPGSVFKLAAALGILNEGVVTPEQKINDPGKITVEERFFENDPNPRTRDYVCYIYKTTGGGHGDLDFIHGLAQSCDVYFYKVGGGYKNEVPKGLNIWRLGEYAKAIGYGRVLGIELPGEQDGLIPDPDWKRINVGENWSTGDTYIATIGQGYVLSTPLQVLVSMATIANDGKLMKPTIVREVLDSEGNVVQPFEPKMLWDITQDPVIHVYDENFLQTGEMKTVAPWVVKKVQEGLREVVVSGTASTIFEGFPIPSAGKTGTAEYCDNVAQKKNLCQPGNWPAHAWYVGYAPFDNPEIAVVAFVYNGDEGARLAAPVVRKVMEAYFNLKEVDTETVGSSQP
ncbi:penicillin-binding protein 2 [Thermanaerothrix sp. 4228-RoL]|jgi:penicillin-binding protein 2|uniref:Penicillin-binding protein 2 n=2 Tax=Thermanaerothrix TaxID=1077886 RepID=A0ABU3NQP8_9CHLR|nr:penicillin-binding protein 2 [Thermanaerothrix sp. 4228-RoL]MDT8899160.1 penicillin-binding protein 2 [Thermanaerothrix sp. 4228-RoL]